MKKKVRVCIIIMTILIIVVVLVITNKKSISKSKDINYNYEDIEITVFNIETKTNMKLELEEYITGVLAMEMPASFELEALKAQAVAARTFAYGRIKKIYSDNQAHPESDVCTDYAHCQAWREKDEFVKDYSQENGEKLWEKIKKAVYDTRGTIITYKGKIANPLYHSNSGGMTESSQDVWEGVEVPYLKSVVSMGDDLGKNFVEHKKIKPKEFLKKINCNKNMKIKDIIASINFNRSLTGRVKEISVAGKKIKGTQFRKIFDLASTNFTIETDGDEILITSYGYGHGVGMSQWGANNFALNGGTFVDILKHYYSGTELETIKK